MTTRPQNSIDLGLIYVVSQGRRDMVYLAHNHLKAFTVSCRPGKQCGFRVNQVFLAYPQTQWDAVFKVYADWKRKQVPEVHLPNHSGLRKDGSQHPWRQREKSKKAKVPLDLRSEQDFQDEDDEPFPTPEEE